jgi:crotonobetainyl-CoA:carnitine CoA-transferase CaiB-like acyl-CoA transferase
MNAALSDLLVVSLEQAVAAPFCSCRLADAGARVIKIERPEGDFARGSDRVARGQSSYFVWLNRGKESVTLDIKRDEDKALLRRLVGRADVFIQNLAPGAASRAGFDPEALRRAHPRLVVCSISGYGESGPYRDMKAYDLLIQSETGLAEITGPPEAPGRVGVSISDLTAGLNAYAGILEALLRRARTGAGAHVEVSLFDATAELMAVPLLHHDYGGRAPRRAGLAHPSIAPYGAFVCADGKKIVISIQNEREWVRLCAAVLESPALATDPRFADNEARIANRPALDGLVAEIFARYPREALAERLFAAGIAFGRLNSVADFSAHPHLDRVEVPTPGGDVSMPTPPGGLAAPPGRVPALGEHTEAVRREFAS